MSEEAIVSVESQDGNCKELPVFFIKRGGVGQVPEYTVGMRRRLLAQCRSPSLSDDDHPSTSSNGMGIAPMGTEPGLRYQCVPQIGSPQAAAYGMGRSRNDRIRKSPMKRKIEPLMLLIANVPLIKSSLVMP